MNRLKNEPNEAYIVISANYDSHNFGQGKWNNLNYCGFYMTIEEAENEINGYLKYNN